MVATILFLAIMTLLFKVSKIDKWWLWFTVIVGLLAQFGYELRSIWFLVAVAICKVLKECFTSNRFKRIE
jgi:hypothetical protein